LAVLANQHCLSPKCVLMLKKKLLSLSWAFRNQVFLIRPKNRFPPPEKFGDGWMGAKSSCQKTFAYQDATKIQGGPRLLKWSVIALRGGDHRVPAPMGPLGISPADYGGPNRLPQDISAEYFLSLLLSFSGVLNSAPNWAAVAPNWAHANPFRKKISNCVGHPGPGSSTVNHYLPGGLWRARGIFRSKGPKNPRIFLMRKFVVKCWPRRGRGLIK